MEMEILRETVGQIVDAFGSDLEMIKIERAVFGLFFTGLGTFVVWNAKFGRKNLHQVHLEKAQHALVEAGGELAAATPVSEAVEQKE